MPRQTTHLAGVPMKHVILAALVVQNAASVLLTHYSRHMPLVNGDRYFTSTAVLLAEVIKLSIFLSVALYEVATGPQASDSPTISQLAGSLSKAVFTADSWKLALPALLYTIQNTLLYVAASNLDASTWAVTSQAKLISTAIFSVVLLGRVLDVRKWLSLGLMGVSIAVVQISYMSQQEGVLSMQDLRDGVSFHSPRSIWDMEGEGNVAAGKLNAAGSLRKRSATYEGIDEDVAAASPRRNASVGLAAALATCILAGVAGVYFERVLKMKDSRVSVWVRNVQLSLYALLPALFFGVFFTDTEHLARTGFFTGYSWVVWAVIVLQALGGVLVAMAVSYTDSTTKSLTTSVSTVLVLLVSLLSSELNTAILYLLGTLSTLTSAYLFHNSSPTDKQQLRPPPINISQYEKSSDDGSNNGGGGGYFDLEAIATPARSPATLQNPYRDAMSTSRPGTPNSERRHRAKSPGLDMRFSMKRDQ